MKKVGQNQNCWGSPSLSDSLKPTLRFSFSSAQADDRFDPTADYTEAGAATMAGRPTPTAILQSKSGERERE